MSEFIPIITPLQTREITVPLQRRKKDSTNSPGQLDHQS